MNKRMMESRKGQITIFIIIGVILLFSTALVLYIKGQVSVPEREVRVALEQVPTELQPVQQFVTGCLEQVAMEAFNLIGAHGGYISVETSEYSGFDFEKNDERPTEADVVAFPPKTKNYVPYWEYMKKPDNCEVCYLGSWRPPLYRSEGGNSIESQVDKYVERNLRNCLRNFESFRQEGYTITEAGGIKATTFIRERDVLVSLNYSIDVSKAGGATTRMSLYQANLPIAFKKIYDMAKYIIDTSAESRFLGLNTLNLISGFSRVDSNALPPFYDLVFSYETVTWQKSKVKQILIQILEIYVQAIQLEGTRGFDSPARFDDPIMKGLYGGMVLPGKEVSDLDVNFMYLGWPIYFEIVGSNSDALKPTTLEMPFLNLLPFKDYRFVYDISYPVIVRISDPSAYRGRGYTFAFAMEANIRNNDAVSNEFITLPAIDADYSVVSEFCKELHRNSGVITVKTTDAETGRPLDGVNVIFRSSQQCSMGITALDEDETSENFGSAYIESQFPVGIGMLILKKPGYATRFEQLATAVGKPQRLSFSLDPLKQVNATVKKKKILSGQLFNYLLGLGVVGLPEELGDHDIIMLSIEKIAEHPEEEPVVSMLAFGIEMEEEHTNITLVPGKYRVMINFMLNRTVVIPKDKVRSGGFFGIGEECAEIPEMKFEIYSFPPTEFEWEVSERDIAGVSEVEFYALYSDLPKKHEDMNKIAESFGAFANNLNYAQYRPVLK